MSETSQMFDDMLNNTESFFVPGEAKKPEHKNAPNTRGEFYGHMQESSNREVSWERNGEKFKALVYNYKFVVDTHNEGQSYTTKDGRAFSGKEYVGRSYQSNGIFRFLEPQKDDDFVSNSKGNDRYLMFCENIGLEIPRKVVKMKGQDVEVQVLPPLKGTDIDGQPVIAMIDAGKPYTNKEGQERTPYVVKFIKKWEGGVKKDAEIPF